MSLKSRLADAHAAVKEVAHLIEINASDLAASEEIMAAGRKKKNRAPRGSVQLHKKFQADQRERILKQAALQAELSRLEKEFEALGPDGSSPLSTCSEMSEDDQPLPSINNQSRMSQTPAPPSPGPSSTSAIDGASSSESLDAPTNTPAINASDGAKMGTAVVIAEFPPSPEASPAPTAAAPEGPEVIMADGTQEPSFLVAGVEAEAVQNADGLMCGTAVAGLEESVSAEEIPVTMKTHDVANKEAPVMQVAVGQQVLNEGEDAAMAVLGGGGTALPKRPVSQLADIEITGHDAELFKMEIEEKYNGPLEPAKGGSEGNPNPDAVVAVGSNETAIRQGSRKKAKKGDEEKPDEDEDILDEKDLLEKEEEGRKAIVAFLEKGEEVDPSIRRLARLHQSFLPESATTSQELALHILTTTWNGFACLYHHHSDKDYKARGKKPPVQGFWLLGVTGEVRRRGDKRPASHGHLRCGCSTEAALSYFLWWKTWTLRGPDGNVEPMSAIQFNPRARNLVMQKLEQLTGITTDDLYPQDGISYSSLV